SDWGRQRKAAVDLVGRQRGFFYPQRHSPGTHQAGAAAAKPALWGEVFGCLIDHGHRFGDLRHYTARQLKLFHEQALKRELTERMHHTLDGSASFAGGKTLKGYIDKFKQALKRR
ncbi:TPA: hypothetical protein SMF71_005132, partial [Serratia marcescens]|nr:hypothetical protein [Serratia marcescens]